MAATAIAVQGVAAFFGGVTIPLFESTPEGDTGIPQTTPTNAPSFSQPASAPISQLASVPTGEQSAKLISNSNKSSLKPTKQLATTSPVQKFAPISLPTDITAPTNATSGGSGGYSATTSTGTWTSNATSGGSGAGGGNSSSSGNRDNDRDDDDNDRDDDNENEDD